MTRKIILDLAFKIWSPSLYELEARDAGDIGSVVAVAFGQDHRWHINVLMKRGHTITRGPFRSRDEAIALIAGRRQAVENWG